MSQIALVQQETLLIRHTQQYWRLSRIWNDQSEEFTTVEKALTTLNNIYFHIDPERPLARRCNVLADNIVLNNVDGVA